MSQFETKNPATDEKLAIYENMTEGQILSKIVKMEMGYRIWKLKSISERIDYLARLKSEMQKCLPELSLLITQTMGKPLLESKLEIEKSISQIDYYINFGPELIEPRKIAANYSNVQVSYLPLGIVFAVMPWNYPVWQFFRFAVGAWLAGNVILFKHSEITTAIGLFLEKIVEEMDGPLILQTVVMDPSFSEVIFSHKSINAITFTGSTKVGRTIGQLSGKNLKKCVLELGGNDAFIVDESGDVEMAAQLAVKGRLTNNGQSCISSKRFFVPAKMAARFMSELELEIVKYSIGDPMEKNTKLGPLAHRRFVDLYNEHLSFINKMAAAQTNTVALPDSKGYFVSPKFVLIDSAALAIEKNYTFFQQEEVFSPLGMVVTYDNDDQLQKMVEGSPYGLGLVWVGDQKIFENKKMNLNYSVGMIAVNDILKSDPRVPFGGIKNSGFGRESGEFGIREFCNVQTVGVK